MILHTGSPAPEGLASRSDADRIKHIDCRICWVQEALKGGRVRLKVLGIERPAEVLTTAHSKAELATPFARLGATLIRRAGAA